MRVNACAVVCWCEVLFFKCRSFEFILNRYRCTISLPLYHMLLTDARALSLPSPDIFRPLACSSLCGTFVQLLHNDSMPCFTSSIY